MAATASNGRLIWREAFTPFGESLNAPADNIDQQGFTGHIRDTATGLTYMQARYYNPVVGRFLSNDPVGFAEGGADYFNRYSYTANDPVNAIDPDGRQQEEVEDQQRETALSATGVGVEGFTNTMTDAARETAATMGTEAVESSTKVLRAIDNVGKVGGTSLNLAAKISAVNGAEDRGTETAAQTVGLIAGVVTSIALSETGPGAAIGGAAVDIMVTNATRSVINNIGNIDEVAANTPPIRAAVSVHTQVRDRIYYKYCPGC